MYELRFWSNNVNIEVMGHYSYSFQTFREAYEVAVALLPKAVEQGAREIDINNEFYPIIDD